MTKEEVLEILEHNWTCLKNHAYTDNELDEALEFIIKDLRQTQPKIGHWIDDTDKIAWKCSECGWWYRDWKRHNFCPNCGCRMVGESQERSE